MGSFWSGAASPPPPIGHAGLPACLPPPCMPYGSFRLLLPERAGGGRAGGRKPHFFSPRSLVRPFIAPCAKYLSWGKTTDRPTDRPTARVAVAPPAPLSHRRRRAQRQESRGCVSLIDRFPRPRQVWANERTVARPHAPSRGRGSRPAHDSRGARSYKNTFVGRRGAANADADADAATLSDFAARATVPFL